MATTTTKTTKAKKNWVIHIAVPWMTAEDATDMKAKGKVQPYRGRASAVAIARLHLRELGEGAKVRAFCPDTGDYTAMLLGEGGELKVYNGQVEQESK